MEIKIEKVEINQINLPLKEPFIISYKSYESIPSIIIKVYTDEGIVGFGESVPDEHVTGESVDSVFVALTEYLIPAVIGEDPRNIRRIHSLMNQSLVNNGAAKAAIDIACYDILGKASNLPIYSLLGGRKDEQPIIPKVLSILEPEVLAAQAKEAVAEGYQEIKMKLGKDSIKDIARVKAVREAIGPNIPIRVDVNQGWKTVQVAREAIQKLTPYNVSWVEQPISHIDVSLFKKLKGFTNVPLMADESMVTAENLRTFIEDSSVEYINIKLMKSGGIYPSVKLAMQAELFGISCQIGSMVESSIASAAAFHVALSQDNIISTEVSGPTKFTMDTGNLTYDLPHVHISSEPGLGIKVNEENIKKLSVKRDVLK